MYEAWYKLLSLVGSNTFYAIMKAMGLGLTVMYITQAAFEQMFRHMQAQMNNFEYVQLLGLIGVDDGLSIIFGAIMTRVSMNASKVFLTRNEE